MTSPTYHERHFAFKFGMLAYDMYVIQKFKDQDI
jgi:hypothetical protein